MDGQEGTAMCWIKLIMYRISVKLAAAVVELACLCCSLTVPLVPWQARSLCWSALWVRLFAICTIWGTAWTCGKLPHTTDRLWPHYAIPSYRLQSLQLICGETASFATYCIAKYFMATSVLSSSGSVPQWRNSPRDLSGWAAEGPSSSTQTSKCVASWWLSLRSFCCTGCFVCN